MSKHIHFGPGDKSIEFALTPDDVRSTWSGLTAVVLRLRAPDGTWVEWVPTWTVDGVVLTASYEPTDAELLDLVISADEMSLVPVHVVVTFSDGHAYASETDLLEVYPE